MQMMKIKLERWEDTDEQIPCNEQAVDISRVWRRLYSNNLLEIMQHEAKLKPWIDCKMKITLHTCCYVHSAHVGLHTGVHR